MAKSRLPWAPPGRGRPGGPGSGRGRRPERDLEPGDLVVADELRTEAGKIAVPAEPLVAGTLRRAGLRVRLGLVVSTPRVAHGDALRRLARTGALAVDNESAYLVGQAAPGPGVVIRAIVDSPAQPLLRPGTAARGLRALGSLRAAAHVIDQWASAVGEWEVVLGAPRSFCAGVARAIEIVERALERYGSPVYVRRQIVHNRHVVIDLEARGAVLVAEVEEIPAGSVAVLAAHGVAPSVRDAAEVRQLHLIDATCPLVSKVHAEVRRFAARGDTGYLIGHHDHEEVVDARGEVAEHVVVVSDPDEAARVARRDPCHRGRPPLGCPTRHRAGTHGC